MRSTTHWFVDIFRSKMKGGEPPTLELKVKRSEMRQDWVKSVLTCSRYLGSDTTN